MCRAGGSSPAGQAMAGRMLATPKQRRSYTNICKKKTHCNPVFIRACVQPRFSLCDFLLKNLISIVGLKNSFVDSFISISTS